MSLSEYIELRILPTALELGIRESEFLEMTIPEISRYADAYKRRMEFEAKQKANLIYTHAVLVGNAFSRVMSGGDFPTIEQTFPSLFDTEDAQEIKQKQITDLSVKRFLLFKERNNARFELKGDTNNNDRGT